MAPRHPKRVGGKDSEGPRTGGHLADGQTSVYLDAPPEQQRGEARAEASPPGLPLAKAETSPPGLPLVKMKARREMSGRILLLNNHK